jgi:hypothetical protein
MNRSEVDVFFFTLSNTRTTADGQTFLSIGLLLQPRKQRSLLD